LEENLIYPISLDLLRFAKALRSRYASLESLAPSQSFCKFGILQDILVGCFQSVLKDTPATVHN